MVDGLTVSELLTQMTETIRQALSPAEDDAASILDFDSDAEMDDNLDFLDDEEWSSPKRGTRHFAPPSHSANPNTSEEHSVLRAKISEDLRQAKLAGFKAGYLGNVGGNIIVCISCRIAKLGISEEVMQAWGVRPRQYLVFLIRYQDQYFDLDQILHNDKDGASMNPEMQVSLCDSYKPSYSAAMNAFRNISTLDAQSSKTTPPGQEPNDHTLIYSFISKPLNVLMNERFIKILGYRFSYGLEWSAAELFYNDNQGKSTHSEDPIDDRYISSEMHEAPTTTLPGLVTADHVKQIVSFSTKSFPLIGMQFVLRHFVRCTEFCLVCHCKTNAGFEALKPYVCSKSLCLFQYMALGFGPSLEWEIMSQPYVVDLLVSFTYCAASSQRLKDFPVGLAILVPSEVQYPYARGTSVLNPRDPKLPADSYSAEFNGSKMELKFQKPDTYSPLCIGEWVMVTLRNCKVNFHCRVQDTSLWPIVNLTEPIQVSRQNQHDGLNLKVPHGLEDVWVFPYKENFDSNSEERKRSLITTLLDTLPDVEEMRDFLMKQDSTEPSLAKWRERISKSALDVLRWIVASNRSCIIQDHQSTPSKEANSKYKSINETRVSGMEGYMQFRFAQGAPDKEQRFVDAVADATGRLKLTSPTLFAWHGSPLSNWHGILREGLHFKQVSHGRAYGNGVYLSPDFHVSSAYMNSFYADAGQPWAKSKLKITSAISLNEVVNSPSEFVSQSPHLVVSKLDWIQPRYLFVRCGSIPEPQGPPGVEKPSIFYHQDPKYTAKGPNSRAVNIPITAINQRRRPQHANAGGKKRGFFASLKVNEEDSDAEVSEATDDEDLEILRPVVGEVETRHVDKQLKIESMPQGLSCTPKTDFVPGSLSGASLPLLAAPSYATTGATKALQRDLSATLKIQQKEPLHELGWYIDSNLISTVYQWIVELHSFDPSLPLAADLKAAGLTSVVMELRFSKDYPMSPPFARIIRPRFLGFMHGGGGHVTAGGALCMELLTNSGWSAVSSIESVLLQIRLALSSTEPKPARLEMNQCGRGGKVREYAVGEAVDAFIRACRAHGWEVPKEFDRMGMLELAKPDSEMN